MGDVAKFEKLRQERVGLLDKQKELRKQGLAIEADLQKNIEAIQVFCDHKFEPALYITGRRCEICCKMESK